MLSDAELEEIEARSAARSKGTWSIDPKIRIEENFGWQITIKTGEGNDILIPSWIKDLEAFHEEYSDPMYHEAALENARFVANAPHDIEALLEEVRRLKRDPEDQSARY